MNRNYKQLLAKVLNAMYAEKGQQNRVKEILSSYGKDLTIGNKIVFISESSNSHGQNLKNWKLLLN